MSEHVTARIIKTGASLNDNNNNKVEKDDTIDVTIDLDKLSEEIAKDIASDQLYRAEDAMKKRAIHTSRNYDEFRAFVACSQNKPVKNGEMADLIGGVYNNPRATNQKQKPRTNNRCSNSRQQQQQQQQATQNLLNGCQQQPPKTSMEFTRNWRRHKRQTDRKRFLNKFVIDPIDIIPRMFRVEMDASLMSEILECLYLSVVFEEQQQPQDDDDQEEEADTAVWILSWLKAISQCGRFDLNICFLATNEKQRLQMLFDYCKSRLSFTKEEDYDDIKCLSEVYSIII